MKNKQRIVLSVEFENQQHYSLLMYMDVYVCLGMCSVWSSVWSSDSSCILYLRLQAAADDSMMTTDDEAEWELSKQEVTNHRYLMYEYTV